VRRRARGERGQRGAMKMQKRNPPCQPLRFVLSLQIPRSQFAGQCGGGSYSVHGRQHNVAVGRRIEIADADGSNNYGIGNAASRTRVTGRSAHISKHHCGLESAEEATVASPSIEGLTDGDEHGNTLAVGWVPRRQSAALSQRSPLIVAGRPSLTLPQPFW
jgi:hypothetical protein